GLCRDIEAQRPGSPASAPRRKADRVWQGALRVLHDPGLAEPGASVVELDAVGGQSDARFQRQLRRPRLIESTDGIGPDRRPPAGRCPGDQCTKFTLTVTSIP